MAKMWGRILSSGRSVCFLKTSRATCGIVSRVGIYQPSGTGGPMAGDSEDIVLVPFDGGESTGKVGFIDAVYTCYQRRVDETIDGCFDATAHSRGSRVKRGSSTLDHGISASENHSSEKLMI